MTGYKPLTESQCLWYGLGMAVFHSRPRTNGSLYMQGLFLQELLMSLKFMCEWK